MKTAEEWMSQMSGLNAPALLTINRQAIREIQLDAFKAGMTEAAGMCYGAPKYIYLWKLVDDAMKNKQQAILTARDNKQSLP